MDLTDAEVQEIRYRVQRITMLFAGAELPIDKYSLIALSQLLVKYDEVLREEDGGKRIVLADAGGRTKGSVVLGGRDEG